MFNNEVFRSLDPKDRVEVAEWVTTWGNAINPFDTPLSAVEAYRAADFVAGLYPVGLYAELFRGFCLFVDAVNAINDRHLSAVVRAHTDGGWWLVVAATLLMTLDRRGYDLTVGAAAVIVTEWAYGFGASAQAAAA